MGEWFEALEYYFETRWRPDEGPAGIPNPIYKAIKPMGGEAFDVDLVHPVDYDDDRIAFVMIKGDETFLFNFVPPDTVTTTFLGSLAGGRYTETTITLEDTVRIEGRFDHPRLGPDGPFRFTLEPLSRADADAPGALERTEELRRTFRHWSTEPLPPQPPAVA
ncbi:MAG: hypothetical protein ACRDMU_01500 [Gaiellaceae bacterium]